MCWVSLPHSLASVRKKGSFGSPFFGSTPRGGGSFGCVLGPVTGTVPHQSVRLCCGRILQTLHASKALCVWLVSRELCRVQGDPRVFGLGVQSCLDVLMPRGICGVMLVCRVLCWQQLLPLSLWEHVALPCLVEERQPLGEPFKLLLDSVWCCSPSVVAQSVCASAVRQCECVQDTLLLTQKDQAPAPTALAESLQVTPGWGTGFGPVCGQPAVASCCGRAGHSRGVGELVAQCAGCCGCCCCAHV